MDPARIERLLKDVATGKIAVAEALDGLRQLPFESLGHSMIDHHRQLRTGVPEVIYGESKTAEQIAEIAQRITARKTALLATRVDAEKARLTCERLPDVTYDAVSRTLRWLPPSRKKPQGLVCVVTAGTSDIPVAEEAAMTLEIMNANLERVYDVGVAGVHRLLDRLPLLQKARAIVVAAGMEGALASIVGGMVPAPVVALPTSVGYGASFKGVAALLGMLTSCAPGVAVVNIDNGFGAGVMAGLINRRGR